MKITEVRIFPCRGRKLKAYATVTFDESFVVRDMKLIEGLKGLFLLMPSRKLRDGSTRDIAHPINSQTRQMIEKAVFGEYDMMKSSGQLDEQDNATFSTAGGQDEENTPLPAAEHGDESGKNVEIAPVPQAEESSDRVSADRNTGFSSGTQPVPDSSAQAMAGDQQNPETDDGSQDATGDKFEGTPIRGSHT